MAEDGRHLSSRQEFSQRLRACVFNKIWFLVFAQPESALSIKYSFVEVALKVFTNTVTDLQSNV